MKVTQSSEQKSNRHLALRCRFDSPYTHWNAELFGELEIPWLDQDGPIGEDNGRDTAVAVVDPLHVLRGFGIPVHVNVFVGDAVIVEKFFGAPAIGTPGGTVDDDLVGHEILLGGKMRRTSPVELAQRVRCDALQANP